MSQKNENVDPAKVKTWIKLAIAILSAILGALGEASTSALSNLLNI